jgi:hypothetical protein
MKNLFTIAVALLCANSANAKEYLGFNLCGKMTAAQIQIVAGDKPLSLRDFDVPLLEGQTKTPDIKVFEISNYPVGKDFLDLEVKTFKDLVYEIEIDTEKAQGYPHPDVIIENKYGKSIAKRKSLYRIQTVFSNIFNTTAFDPNLELTKNYREWLYIGGKFDDSKDYISYLCKPVSKNLKQLINAVEIKKQKDAMKEAQGKSKF